MHQYCTISYDGRMWYASVPSIPIHRLFVDVIEYAEIIITMIFFVITGQQ